MENASKCILDDEERLEELFNMQNGPIANQDPLTNLDISRWFNDNIHFGESVKKECLENPEKCLFFYPDDLFHFIQLGDEYIIDSDEQVEYAFWNTLNKFLGIYNHILCNKSYPDINNTVVHGLYANICRSFIDQYDLIMGIEQCSCLYICLFLQDNQTEVIAAPNVLKNTNALKYLLKILRKNRFSVNFRARKPRQKQLIGWRKIKLNDQVIDLSNKNHIPGFVMKEDRLEYTRIIAEVFWNVLFQIYYFLENSDISFQRVIHKVVLMPRNDF